MMHTLTLSLLINNKYDMLISRAVFVKEPRKSQRGACKSQKQKENDHVVVKDVVDNASSRVATACDKRERVYRYMKVFLGP